MKKRILQLENIDAFTFKKEIVDDLRIVILGLLDHQPDKDLLLTRDATAQMLSISLVTLWSWSKKDIIPSHRIGNHVLYKKSDIMAALQKQNCHSIDKK